MECWAHDWHDILNVEWHKNWIEKIAKFKSHSIFNEGLQVIISKI